MAVVEECHAVLNSKTSIGMEFYNTGDLLEIAVNMPNEATSIVYVGSGVTNKPASNGGFVFVVRRYNFIKLIFVDAIVNRVDIMSRTDATNWTSWANIIAV